MFSKIEIGLNKFLLQHIQVLDNIFLNNIEQFMNYNSLRVTLKWLFWLNNVGNENFNWTVSVNKRKLDQDLGYNK